MSVHPHNTDICAIIQAGTRLLSCILGAEEAVGGEGQSYPINDVDERSAASNLKRSASTSLARIPSSRVIPSNRLQL